MAVKSEKISHNIFLHKLQGHRQSVREQLIDVLKNYDQWCTDFDDNDFCVDSDGEKPNCMHEFLLGDLLKVVTKNG